MEYKEKLLSILFLATLLSIGAPKAFAGTATLNWNPNTEPDLAGYKVYYDTVSRAGNCPAGYGSNVVTLGKVTSYTFNNLTNGSTYYFQVAAYDLSGNQSACSAEVTKSIPVTVGDTTPPVTTTSLLGGTYASSQIVTLSVNEPATIYYTLDGSTPTTASLVYSSPIAITASKTLKYFAKDTAGNAEAVKSQVYTINTVTTDIVSPTMQMVSPTNGSIVSGIISLAAAAVDNVGVVGVQFKIDGVNAGAEVAVAPYLISYDTAQLTNGTHVITAIARDAANNQTTGAVTVNVANSVSPSNTLSVKLTATPASGVAPLKSVSLKAVTSGTQTGTTNYTFYCNRSDAGTDVTAPYSYKRNNSTSLSLNASKLCTYSTPGVYTPKVIIERGVSQAQAQVTVQVSQPATSTKFTLNSRVYVTSGPLNVRSTPATSGTLLGTQATRAKGTVIGGPVFAGGYWWWNINYDTGVDGWSVENYLRKL